VTILTLEQYHLTKLPSGTIFEFHDVALVVLFDLHGRSPTAMQRLALVFRRCSGTRNGVEGIPVNDHGSSRPEMVFEMAGVGTNPA
jgi:hypothetical protein